MNTTTKRPPEAFRSTNLFDTGMGYVVVSRFKSDGQVESGVFLLDVFCLGVKNAFFSRLNQNEYEIRLVQRVFARGKATYPIMKTKRGISLFAIAVVMLVPALYLALAPREPSHSGR